MRISMLKITLGCVAVVSMTSGAAFAQGGGNGNGGSGGNAHGAATAGMTHWGDPVPSPLDVMPGSTTKKMNSMDRGMQSMSPDDSMNAAKPGAMK